MTYPNIVLRQPNLRKHRRRRQRIIYAPIRLLQLSSLQTNRNGYFFKITVVLFSRLAMTPIVQHGYQQQPLLLALMLKTTPL